MYMQLKMLRSKCKHFYYKTINYKPCYILSPLLNIRLVISISGPKSNINVEPGTQVLFINGPAFLSCDTIG